MRRMHTKFAFAKMLRRLGCDLILDVGSRDAQESLIFAAACPGARVIALEANPYNAARIRQNPAVAAASIQLLELAAWKEEGSVTFHVTDCDYSDPRANTGTSGIKPHFGLPQTAITVPAVTLAALIEKEAPTAQRVAIWIDVEGAEAEVIEGLAPAMAKVAMIHVETATSPMHEGQRLLPEIDHILAKGGMHQAGGHMDGGHWGDVLYINQSVHPGAFSAPLILAWLLAFFPRRRIASALFHRAPRLHASLKAAFARSPSLSGF